MNRNPFVCLAPTPEYVSVWFLARRSGYNLRFRGKLKIRSLHNGIHGTGFLTKATVNALCHVNIIARRSTRTILPLLHFNGNGLRGTCRFTQFARNATLFARRIATQRMFATKTWRNGTMFKGIINCNARLEKNFGGQPPRLGNLGDEKDFGRIVQNLGPWRLF
jgi:hypothetical protein